MGWYGEFWSLQSDSDQFEKREGRPLEVGGLSDEFEEARSWVEEEMIIGVDKDVNLFETTICVLGGLLSTYHLTQDKLFFERVVSMRV